MANDPMFNSVTAYLNKLSDSDDEDSFDEIPSNGTTPYDFPPIDGPPGYASAVNPFASQLPIYKIEGKATKQICITGLREPFGNESNREAADTNTVQQILWAIDAGEFVNEIQKLTRIGPYLSSSEPPRPIIVSFKSEEAQKAALFNAEKVKKVPEWKDVSIKLYQTAPTPSASQIYDPEKEEMKQKIDAMQKQMAALMQQFQPRTEQSNGIENSQNPVLPQENTHFPPPPTVDQPQIPNSYANPQRYQQMPPFPNPINNEMPQNMPTPQMPSQSGSNIYSPKPQPQSDNGMLNSGPVFMNPQGQPYSPMELAAIYQMFLQSQQNPNVPPQLPQQNVEAENSSEEESEADEEASDEEEEESSAEESESEGEENLATILNKENSLFKAQGERHVGSKKTLNILVLGETGVGKSTWINGIANYLSFDTLEDAIAAWQPICLIASKFDFYETNEDKIEVKLEPSHGEKDENEAFSDQGQSSTQEPKTYQFETAKYIVNIIDTPGIGDTRGPEQDKENTRKILNAIGQYKDLHAICFLFKANEARMTLSFRYCISELLLQLHKDAVDNIIFFFTNARGTFYKPGDTMTPLSSFLEDLQRDRGLKISLDSDKICCTDNEAFRLVCAHKSGARFTDEDFLNFAGSWKQSAAETHRFLEFAARSKPHVVADTVSINKARTIILHLAKPLADVNELIVSNIKVFDDRKKDLHNTSNSLDELKKKSKISQIGIEVKPLPYPKTVCASTRCIETSPLPNTEQYQTIYRQICHDHCYLTGVEVEKVPEPHLVHCAAMNGRGTCNSCECSWQSHMHIRFDQIKCTIEIEDKNTKDLIKQNEDAAKVKQQMIKDCEDKVKEFQAEQQKIIDVSLRFGSFLQKNAILPYNDAFEKYVEQTISEEEKCTEVGGDRTKLDNLKKLLSTYRQEKAMLQEASKNPSFGGENRITPEEIDDMKVQLFRLKHSGKTLENLFKATEDGLAMNNRHVTVRYNPAATRPHHPYQAPAYPQRGIYSNSNFGNNKKQAEEKSKKNDNKKWQQNKSNKNGNQAQAQNQKKGKKQKKN